MKVRKELPAPEAFAQRHQGADIGNSVAAPANDPVATLGPQIRALRKTVGLTLSDVAARTGLSVGHLSQVERGLSTPTIRQLQQIAGTMGVTIGWFFQATENADPSLEEDIIVRAPRRRRMALPKAGIVDELLVPHLNGALELLLCTLQPGATSGPDAYAHDGEEAGLVLAGEMDLWVEDRHFRLQAGDSFAFASTRPHRYRAAGDSALKVVWAITPPSY